MRKLICLFTILLIGMFTSTAMAIDEWVTANQATVMWDAVVQSDDGTPVEGALEYAVFLDKENKNNSVEIWRGADTQATITIDSQGRYLVGVKAYLIVNGITESESIMAWSDDPLVALEGTFGVVYFKNPKHPTNLVK